MPFDKDGNWIPPGGKWATSKKNEPVAVQEPPKPTVSNADILSLGRGPLDRSKLSFQDYVSLGKVPDNVNPNEIVKPFTGFQSALQQPTPTQPIDTPIQQPQQPSTGLLGGENAQLVPFVDQRTGLQKTGDFFKSLFDLNSDTHDKIRAGATEFGTGLSKALFVDALANAADKSGGMKRAAENIHQDNLQHLSPEAAKALDIAGQATGIAGSTLATLPLSLPANLARIFPAANTVKTATGALRATAPALERTALDQAGNIAARAGLVKAGSDYARGATTPDMENRSLFSEFGASMTAGTGDIVEGTGHAAKWLGMENLGNDMVNRGQQIKQGYEIPMEEFSWKSLLNPRFYAVTAGRALPFTIAMLPMALGGAAAGGAAAGALGVGALGRTIMQAIGASVLSTPFEAAIEAGGVYEQARQNGMSEEEANKAANKAFMYNAALLGFTNATEFATAFAPKGFSKAMNRMGMNTTAARIAGTGIQEGAQEGAQELISKKALGEKIDLRDPALWEQVAVGGLMGAGFGALGSARGNVDQAIPEFYQTVKNQLPAQAQAELDKMVQQHVIEGKDEIQATAEVLETMAQQPEGEQLITETIQNEIAQFQATQPEEEMTQETIAEPTAQTAQEALVTSPEPSAVEQGETAPEPQQPIGTNQEKPAGVNIGDTVTVKQHGPNKQFEVTGVSGDKVTLKNKADGKTLTVKQSSVASVQPAQNPVDTATEPGTEPAAQQTSPNATIIDDSEIAIMRHKSAQTGKEDWTVRLHGFLGHKVDIVKSDLNETYIARFQGQTKVLDNFNDAVSWSKNRLKEEQSRQEQIINGAQTTNEPASEAEQTVVGSQNETAAESATQPDVQQMPETNTATEEVSTTERVQTSRPLPEKLSELHEGEFEQHIRAMKSLVNTFKTHMQNGSLPNTQKALREIAGKELGRVASEDEWSDTLEAAAQLHAIESVKKDKTITENVAKQLIESGQRAEQSLKNAGRSLEKTKRQQYSTPIPLAAVANYALDVRPGETVKEGSAGTGSLILPLRELTNVNVKAVELSPRRAAILKALGFDVENADTFKTSVKSDVVIGNPPFRGQNVGKGTTDFAGKPPWTGGWGDLGNRFLAWDLRSIPNSGRLVHITSPSVIEGAQNAAFRKWLTDNHTVRAMIKIHEGAYDSRGTKFGAGIIVVDKGKIEGASEPIKGTVTSWENLLEMVKPLAEGGTHARTENVVGAGTSGQSTPGNRNGGESTTVLRPEPKQPVNQPTTPDGRSGDRVEPNRTEGGESSGPVGGRADQRVNDSGAKPSSDPVEQERPADVVEPKREDVSSDVSSGAKDVGRANIERVSTGEESKSARESDNNVPGFVEYIPRTNITGRKHLGSVVEPSNLQFVEVPSEVFNAKYKPVEQVVKGKDKALSDVQLEAVMLSKYNWYKDKRGMLIADDTGLGKTAEQLGIAADAWHSGRAKRILIVTKTDQIALSSFIGENSEFGFDIPMTLVNPDSHENFKDKVFKDAPSEWTKLPIKDGAIVMSQYTFRDAQKAVNEWLNESDKLLVLFDESHILKNVDNANVAIAAAELYNNFKDKAQFIYSSATAAEDISGLEHMFGLHLWGTSEFGDFRMRLQGAEPGRSSGGRSSKNKLARNLGGKQSPFQREVPLSMMEQIVRELKMEGQYLGRALSMDGIEMDAIPIKLSSKDKGDWNRAVEFIQRIAQKAEEHGQKVTDRGKIMAGVVGYMRRLRGYYVTKGIIEHMKAQMASGELERFALSGFFKSGDEGKNAMLEAAIGAINDQDKSKGSGGEVVYTDIPEAIEDKNELIAMLHGEHSEYNFTSPVPELESPIKMLYDAFGEDQVLVISGDISSKERVQIVKQFQAGEKPIVFFTQAGQTGVNLHDTIGKPIGFYHVDYPYEAKEAKQSEGRVNRTGQTTKPKYFYPHTESSVDTKFVGTLVARYEAMGALSRGKTSKLGGESLGNFDFTGPIAEIAVERIIAVLDPDIRAEMFGNWTREAFSEDITTNDPAAVRTVFGGKVDVKKFLNALMFLDFDTGNDVFNQFVEVVEQVRQEVEAEGGVSEKFETFNGKELSVTEGSQNIKIRKIKTLLSEQQKRSFETKVAKAEVALETAKEELEETKSKILAETQEKYEKQQTEYNELKSKMDEALQDLRKASGNEYEKASKTFEKSRAKLVAFQEKWEKTKRILNGIKNNQFDEIPSARRLQAKAEMAEYRLLNAQAEKDANDVVMLIDGKIATSGLMVPIRVAIRKAAQTHYKTDSPPPAALKVEMRGYYMENGKKVVGAVVPTWAEGEVAQALHARLAFTGGNESELWEHIKSGHDVTLENGFELTYNKNMNAIIIKGMSPSKHRELYEQLNKDGNVIGFHAISRAFVIPKVDGLKKLIDRYPIKSLGESSEEYALSMSAERKPRSARENATQAVDISTLGTLSPLVTKKVAKIVATYLQTPLRDLTAKATAEGTFNRKSGSGSVRKRSFYEWRVVGHELGHAFSFTYGGPVGVKRELKALAEQTYPGKIPKGREFEEGFAEFFYIWTMDPAKAKEWAPQTTELFEDFIGKNKDLSMVMAKARTVIDNHLGGTALEQGLGAIVSHVATNTQDIHGEEYTVPLTNRFVFNHVDSTLPAGAMMKDVDDTSIVDLRKIVSISGDAEAKGLMSFKSQATDYKGGHIDAPILQELMEKGINLIGETISWKKVKVHSIGKKLGALEIFSLIGLSNRIIERYGKGFEQLPLTLEQAEAILTQSKRMFPKEVFDLSEQYAEALSDIILEKLVRADVITRETANNVKKGSSAYYPFFYDNNGFFLVSGKSEQGRTNKNPVKRFTGKRAAVLNLFQASLMKLAEVEQAIEYKRALEALHTVIEKEGMGQYGKIMPAPPKSINVSLDQVMDSVVDLLDEGIDVNEIATDDRLIRVFMPGGFDTIGSKNVVMNVRNGKPTFIRLAPDVFSMMMAMRPVQIEGFAKVLAWSSRITRYTFLATPVYMKNVLSRDLAASLIQSKNNPLKLIGHYHKGLAASLGLNEKVYETYASSGGMSGAAENVMRSLTRTEYDEGILRLGSSGWGTVRMGSKKVLTRIVRTPSEALRVLEEYKRIAEFIATWKRLVTDMGHDGNQLWETYLEEGTDALPEDLQDAMERILVEASYNSREIEANYGVGGVKEWSRKYMPTVTFMKGSVKGIYRSAQLAKNNPGRLAIGVGALSMMSIISWALMNQDDDDKKRYADMDSGARDRYWWYKVPDTEIYFSVAKPYEYGLPANFLERFLDHLWSNEPNARKPLEDWKAAVVESFSIPFLPQFLKTWMDLQSNTHSLGGSIVPQSETMLAKDRQFGANTSDAAKGIANIINAAARLFAGVTGDPSNFKEALHDPNKGVSARQVEYFINNMTGKYGTGVLKGIDWTTALMTGKQTKDTKGIEYAPVIGSLFYSQAEGSSRIVNKFYEDFNKAQTNSQTTGKMMKEGDTKTPAFASEHNIKLIRYLPAMRAIANELSAMRKEYDDLLANADPAQKRKLIMQKDYVQKLATGIMYGVEPATPHPDSGITDAQIQMLVDRFTASAQKALINEQKREGGPTDQAEYLLNLIKK